MDNYLMREELIAIETALAALDSLWHVAIDTDVIDIDIANVRIPLKTAGGDSIGFISWSENGTAFYPENNNDS